MLTRYPEDESIAIQKTYSNESRVPDQLAKNHPGSDVNGKTPPAKTGSDQIADAAAAAGSKDDSAAEHACIKTTVLQTPPG
jgi:hypothetical protein